MIYRRITRSGWYCATWRPEASSVSRSWSMRHCDGFSRDWLGSVSGNPVRTKCQTDNLLFHRSNNKLNRRTKYMRWLDECHHAIHWGNNLRIELFKLKNLGYLVLLAVLVTLAAGLMLFLIDPNIHSPFDGIWSAWVTMTHVGFGDVVPISFFGRLLAAVLI